MHIFPSERERYSQVLARAAHRNYLLYLALGESETNATHKHVFLELAEVAKAEFHFWGTKGIVRADTAQLQKGTVFFYSIVRKLLGSETLVYLLLCGEKARLVLFSEYCDTCIEESEQTTIRILLERSASFVKIVDPDRLAFLKRTLFQAGEVLIFMTSSLVGLSFVFSEPFSVGFAGCIIVIAQTLSIASRPYFHTDHMHNAQLHRSMLVSSGLSFLTSTVLLLPFFFAGSILTALIVLIAVSLLYAILLALSSSVLLQRSFTIQFFHIVTLLFCAWLVVFSVGFIVGSSFPQ